jgi:two-component system NtrC family sensor kinase
MTPITGNYDFRLVVLSFVISILTSFTALDLAARLKAHKGRVRLFWLLGGGFAMGTGIWCMHYTGMLAFRLPIPVYYHIPTVIYSLFDAIIASTIAFYVVSRDRMTPVDVVVGSLFMGSAIATMHYTGMAAMRLKAMHHYNLGIWLLSVILAIVISAVGLFLIFYSRRESAGWKLKLSIAFTMGLAIPVMHYTGMAAVSFRPMATPPDLSRSMDISTLANSAILVVTCVLLGFALLTSMLDRKAAAQKVLLEGERAILRALIDNIPDVVYAKDTESRFTLANRKLAFWLGLETPTQLLGKTDFDFFPSEIATSFFEDEQQIMRTGEPITNRDEIAVTPKGDRVALLTTKVPIRNSQGRITGVAGIGRDVTVRKKSQEAALEAEGRYRRIFDEAIVGIFQTAPTGKIMNVNPAMSSIFGYKSPDEMISNLTDTFFVDNGKFESYASTLAKFGSVKNFEAEVYRKDGARFWISLSVRAVVENGVAVRHEGMLEDITERKLLGAQLLQAQKLESVGQLAAGIAHEINTPIQYVGDNARFLEDSFKDVVALIRTYERLLAAARTESLTSEMIQEIASAVERTDTEYLVNEIPRAIEQTLEGIGRVSTLVAAMKEFSHPATKEKALVDLNRAIQSTIEVTRNEWKYSAEMETDLDPTLPLIPCYLSEFNQVVLILIVNAAHAIADVAAKSGPEKGMIRIQTRDFPGYVEIRVEDTGGGIPDAIRSRVFDPFFTTKEVGKGTGQGLAIARAAVVGKNGGTIDFETEVGKGTSFIIHLHKDAH